LRKIFRAFLFVLLAVGTPAVWESGTAIGQTTPPQSPALSGNLDTSQPGKKGGEGQGDPDGIFQRGLDEAQRSAERGEIDASITTLQELLGRFPENPRLAEVYLRLGMLFMEKEKLPQAIEDFRAVMDKYPASPLLPEARYNLAQAYIGEKDPERAVLLFENVQGEEERKFVDAIDMLEREMALLVSPEREAVRSMIVRTIQDRLKEDDLLEIVRRYPRAFPGDEAHVRLIELYYGREEYHKAEREIRVFSAQFPQHPYVQRAHAILAEMAGRLKSNQILLAVFLPLSGRMAPFGAEALNGIRLALQQYKEGGAQAGSVGLVVKDTEEEKGHLRQTLEEVLSDYSPEAVIGPLLSRDVEQLAGVAEKYGVPLITPGASAPGVTRGWKYVFRNALTESSQSRWVAQYAMSTLPRKRFMILYPRENYGKELMRDFSAEITRLGGEVIDAQDYPSDENDFGTQIRSMKETDLKKYGRLEREEVENRSEYKYIPGFDAIYLAGEAKKVGLILPQLAFYDINNVTLYGNNGWDSEDLIQLAGRFAEGGVFSDGFFVDSPDPAVRDFVSSYRRRYQRDPNLFSAQAYDTAKMVLDAVKSGATHPEQIREALVATKDFQGASGLTAFRPDGEAEKRGFLIQVKDGKFVQIN
jgi:branched-chain amino acid transport system substrate-binding protein